VRQLNMFAAAHVHPPGVASARCATSGSEAIVGSGGEARV